MVKGTSWGLFVHTPPSLSGQEHEKGEVSGAQGERSLKGNCEGWIVMPAVANPPKVSLSESLHRRGLPHLAPLAKQGLQQRILHLQFDTNDPATRNEIAEYCLSDCDGGLALFAAQTGRTSPPWR